MSTTSGFFAHRASAFATTGENSRSAMSTFAPRARAEGDGLASSR